MKKLFTLLLALVTTTAIWAEDFEVDGIYYNILTDKTNEVEVTYSGSYYLDDFDEYSGSVTIPATVTYNGTTYSVTSIGESAFNGCKSLTSVTIGNSVTSIGVAAFCDCKSLTSITIPNSVTSIGESAFAYCSSLTSITIPNSVTSIGMRAFSGCSGLTSITIPNGVTSIEESAFNGCKSLTSITIPNSVTSIGFSAFAYCSSLTSITIPNSVTSIGTCAFEYCSGLTSITIPNSVTSIGNRAFSHCAALTSIVVEESNTMYDSRENCSAIIETASNTLIAGCQNTIIPNSVTSIGDGAFYGCSSLTSITIPNSVTSIGGSAFWDCSSLTSVTIPNSVTSIGEEAFRNCSGLTSVTIPNSVTSIGDYAFNNCSSLTKPVYNAHCFAYMPTSYEGAYTIPEGIKQIAGGAFSGCRNLTSITIPNSVTSIGDGAFYLCSGLTSITIPNSVTSIGGSAFAHCYDLTSITIPNSVTSIGGRAFYRCSGLTSITIPNSVTSIGNDAFYLCSGLTSITIPNSVTSIGNNAFYDCIGLTSIESLAETPPTLGTKVFNNVSTQIPVYVACGSVSAYQSAEGWNAFTNIQEPWAEYSIVVGVNDNKMGTAKVDGNTICGAQISATANYRYRFVQWSDGNTDNPRTLVLTQDTTFTAEFAVSYSGQCGDNLYWAYDEDSKKISITGSGDMYNYTQSTQPWLLFQDQITEVTTSNTTTSIGKKAFAGCVRLSKVSLGYGVENIAANAFAECNRLYDIYCYASYPPFADESSFANYNVYVYIPCENQRDYILDVVWGKFKFIECIGAESEEMEGDGVVITPGSTDVTITWPTEGDAETYTIVIKKGDEVFCKLTFNKDGQLVNIAFAPGRYGNHPAQYAEQAANGGYRFTITSLEEDTKYGYNLNVKNSASQTIRTYSGEFTTGATTSVEDIITNDNAAQKLLRNGQLIILRDGVEYNAQGQIIKE